MIPTNDVDTSATAQRAGCTWDFEPLQGVEQRVGVVIRPRSGALACPCRPIMSYVMEAWMGNNGTS